ncbi:MAG TPA: response regulator [Sphingomonas sp.]|nr:response regulator [Sphingomonas sp.]
MPDRKSCLPSLRVGVVEDETMIALVIEDMLTDAGCAVVGHAGTVADAIAMIERERPDAVTLDGNLAGELSGPVARRCRELSVRFLVVTGYQDKLLTDPDLESAPRLLKPFTAERLLAEAARHLC